jgi:diaminopimelate epimerase
MSQIFKYHGTGNDFIVVDRADWAIDVAALAPALCDRHRGVGGDGVIIVERESEGSDASMVIINRDGSRPEMCGNGIRCVARHLVERHGLDPQLSIATDAGIKTCRVYDAYEPWEVDVDMGAVHAAETLDYEDGAQAWTLTPVDVGNPHAVTFAEASLETIDAIGEQLNRAGSPFTEGVNVEFVRVSGADRLDVVVYERGVGRTNACGTGACAAAYAAWKAGIVTQPEVVVGLPGGDLRIRRESERVWMRGAAEFVFQGTLDEKWLRSRTKQ